MTARNSSGFVDNWQSGTSLVECNLQMLNTEDSCDVTFLVGKKQKRISAHRYILISRSCVFHAMFCGPLAEKTNIKLPDITAAVFKGFLIFLYSDKTKITADNATGLLYLAKKYAVGGLEQQCLGYLETSLSSENACVILEQAHCYDEKSLFQKALTVVTKSGQTALLSDGFKYLCHDCLDQVISSDNFHVKSEDVFKSVMLWAEAECRRQRREITPAMKRLVLKDTVFSIRFSSMDHREFVKTVVPSQILTQEEQLKIFSYFACPEIDISPFLPSSVRFYTSTKESSAECSGGITISYNHDVTVKSLLIYGPKEAYDEKFTVRIWNQNATSCILRDQDSKAILSENPYVHVIVLSQPVKLCRKKNYGVDVLIERSRRPLGRIVVGNALMTVDGFTVTHYRNTKGFIAGLILA